MANFLAVNSLAGVKRLNTGCVEVTTAGRFDATYVANGLNPGGNSADYFEVGGNTFLDGSSSITGTLWLRQDVYTGNNVGGSYMIHLLNGATNAYRLQQPSGATYQMQYWNTGTSAWVNWGSSFVLTGNTLFTVVVKIVLGSSYTVYAGGTSVMTDGGTTPTNPVNAVTIGRYSALGGSGNNVYSQIRWDDYDNRDTHLMSAAFNGNSASNTGGTGAYTDINETVVDDSTSEVVATVGNKMGQTHAAITIPAGLGITGIVLNARARVSGGTVTGGKLGLRSGTTNSSSSGRSYNGGYEPRGALWTTDPNGGGALTQTVFNNAETYIEAA